MKVIRVKVKVVSHTHAQTDIDAMAAELASCRTQIMELKRKNTELLNELETEKRNYTLNLAKAWQCAIDNQAISKIYQFKS